MKSTIMQELSIEPKRDFGAMPHICNGKKITQGFVVVYKGCNIMPGAIWFLSIADALRSIKVLQKVGFNDSGVLDSARFWRLEHRVNGVTQRERDYLAQIREVFPDVTIATSRLV